MKKIVSVILLFFALFIINPKNVFAAQSSGIEFEYYLVDVTSVDEEEYLEVKETFKMSANPSNLKIRRFIFHNELMFDFETNVENYKKNGISYYEFDLQLDKDYYISYKIKSSDVKGEGHIAQFYFKTCYAGARASKEFSIPNLRLRFNTSDKINKTKIKIFGGDVYKASDEYTSIMVSPANKENIEENYVYVYYVYSTFPDITISDYKVLIRYNKEEEKFEIDETFRVETDNKSKEFTKDLDEEYLFESKNCKLKFKQNPDGTYEYRFTNSGSFKCSMLYEVEKKSSEMEEINFAPFMLKPAIKYNLTYKDYYLSLNLEDLEEYSFDIEGCPECRINRTGTAIIMTTMKSTDSIPGVYIKKGSKSIGDFRSIFNKDFYDNLITKAAMAIGIFIVVSIMILVNDKKDKPKKTIRILTIIMCALVYIGMSINAILAAVLIPLFYSYFFYYQFFVPRKNSKLDLFFIIVHPLIFTGSIVSPVAFLILLFTLIRIAGFYKRNVYKK